LKVQIVNDLPMQWEDGYRKALDGYDQEWVKTPQNTGSLDARIFMWCSEDAVKFQQRNYGLPTLCFVRRYEVYAGFVNYMPWDTVAEIVVVNDVIGEMVEQLAGKKPHVIYNSIIPQRWTWKDRIPGPNVAMVGFVNQKKNLPLALQVMAYLPDGVLHIAGEIQDPQVMDYVVNLANSLNVQVRFYGAIARDHMNEWLDDKSFLINPSISEGCPNCVLEALAKGIRPLVHNWPGARQQFGDLVFDGVDQAVRMAEASDYDSHFYRHLAEKQFGEANFMEFRRVFDGIFA
jgi:glycosyltransferase involved in cell wall biosynthesis